MSALKAHVENGRVVLDERVELPEGMTLEVDVAHAVDDILPGDRQKILRAIDDGIAAARRGEHVDAEGFIDELLAEP